MAPHSRRRRRPARRFALPRRPAARSGSAPAWLEWRPCRGRRDSPSLRPGHRPRRRSGGALRSARSPPGPADRPRRPRRSDRPRAERCRNSRSPRPPSAVRRAAAGPQRREARPRSRCDCAAPRQPAARAPHRRETAHWRPGPWRAEVDDTPDAWCGRRPRPFRAASRGPAAHRRHAHRSPGRRSLAATGRPRRWRPRRVFHRAPRARVSHRPARRWPPGVARWPRGCGATARPARAARPGRSRGGGVP